MLCGLLKCTSLLSQCDVSVAHCPVPLGVPTSSRTHCPVPPGCPHQQPNTLPSPTWVSLTAAEHTALYSCGTETCMPTHTPSNRPHGASSSLVYWHFKDKTIPCSTKMFQRFFSKNISFPERRNKRKNVLEITKMYYFKI